MKNYKKLIITILCIINIFPIFTIPKRALVRITSNPNDALVVIVNSNFKIGKTPIDANFTIGETYVLSFTKDGYHQQNYTYICNGNPVHVTLQPMNQQISNKTLTVNSNVNNAKVYINGDEKGRTPCSITLPQATYSVLVKHPGYSDYTTTVNLNFNQTINAILNQSIRSSTLTVNCNIYGASVFINDQEKGKTPLTIELPNANYNVAVRYQGFSDYTASINLDANKTINAVLTAVIRNSRLTVNCNIYGASVFINDQEKGKTPLTIDLPNATYNVVIRYTGFNDYSTTINLDANKTINAVLNASIYRLSINSNINNATVYINNQEKGRTPLTIDLAKAAYDVIVKYPGYTDYTANINLDANKTINAVLNFASYRLTVTSNVNNAVVFINNQEKGRTPLTIQLPAGNYAIVVKTQGHREYAVNINLSGDMTINAELNASKFLKINLPANAKIWLDGIMQAVQPGINIFYASGQDDRQVNVKIQYYELIFEDQIKFASNDKEYKLTLDLENENRKRAKFNNFNDSDRGR